MSGRTWRPLDNAAKIFPPTSSAKDPHVFRFACELNEPVQEELLQQALELTIKLIPVYRVVMKKGLFWYYFEDSPLQPKVSPEDKPVCSPLYHPDRKSLLFAVSYYAARINLEIYHALADGTGALHFLRTLTVYYLKLAHPETLRGLATDRDVEPEQGGADSFEKYYEKTPFIKDNSPSTAYQLKGERLAFYETGVVEGCTSARALVQKSKELGVSVTEFLTALLLCAIHETMALRDEKKPVVITVPVNLRKYFSSLSLRNFFGVVNVGHRFDTQGKNLEEVAAHMHAAFAEALHIDRLRARMNRYSRLEHSILTRSIPLIIKRPALQFAAWLATRAVTATVSNVGIVTMPAETHPYIKCFDVFNSTRKLQLCVCTYGDAMMLSISSNLTSRGVQRSFFRSLTAMGLPVTVSSNISERGR